MAQGVWKVRDALRTTDLCAPRSSVCDTVPARGFAFLVVLVGRSLPDLSPRTFLNLGCSFYFLGAEALRARCRKKRGGGHGNRNQPKKETKKTVTQPWEGTVFSVLVCALPYLPF